MEDGGGGLGGGGGGLHHLICASGSHKSDTFFLSSFFLNLIFGLNVHRDHMWSIRDGVDIWWGYKSDTF